MFPRSLVAALCLGLAALLPEPSLALSCLKPDIDRMWTRATQAPDRYTVVLGQFDFDARALPRKRGDRPTPTYVPARFSGQGLTSDGFTTAMRMNVALEVRCAGPWCGDLVPGQEVIAFLRQRPDGWVAELGPCGGMVWPKPDANITSRLRACMNGADCRAD